MINRVISYFTTGVFVTLVSHLTNVEFIMQLQTMKNNMAVAFSTFWRAEWVSAIIGNQQWGIMKIFCRVCYFLFTICSFNKTIGKSK